MSSARPSTRLTTLAALAARGGDLRHAVLVGLSLDEDAIDMTTCQLERTALLGCTLPPAIEAALRARGALVIPRFAGLPYDPMRSRLYTPEELTAGYVARLEETADYGIYEHFVRMGHHAPDVFEALAQRLHDHAIDEGLREAVGGNRKKVVAIMGGHGASRASGDYATVARLGWLLGRAGYVVASGGGPGIMEAANLGAWLSAYEDPSSVDEAVRTLAEAPAYMQGNTFSPSYVSAALRVRDRFPNGARSLAIPTWFYGHEPTNLFGTEIAKYFSNGLREDTLLAIAMGGVVFAPGSAGTTQEIFMDAAQNHYETFGAPSPMVLLGRQRYAVDTQLHATLTSLAAGRRYAELITLVDTADEALAFLQAHAPG